MGVFGVKGKEGGCVLCVVRVICRPRNAEFGVVGVFNEEGKQKYI